MQSKEHILDLQSVFAKKHVTILIIMLMYIGVNLILSNDTKELNYIMCGVLAGVLFIDIMFAYFQYFHKYMCLVMLRMFEMAVCTALINDGGGLSDVMAILLFSIFAIETMHIFDMTESGVRFVVPFAMQSGFFLRLMLAIVNNGNSGGIHILNYLFISVVSFSFYFAMARFIGTTQKYYDDWVLSKDRMLDRAKDNSDKINESQKNMMMANEQLGIKKYELEEAYKQINRANADIELQNKCLSVLMSSFELNDIQEKLKVIFNERFELSYVGLIFKNDRINKKFNCSIDGFLNHADAEAFCDYFLSYAFIHEHRKLGKNYINNSVSYDEFPFLQEAGVTSLAIKTIELDKPEHTCIYFLASKLPNMFDSKEILLDNIFGQIQVMANNISLYYEIQDMSIRDALSGLYNRRYLNEYVETELIKHTMDSSLGLAMIDIDHFKNINDTYGHLFGDQAIKTVAGLIKKYAEDNNGMAFRYGGEEFVVVFENKTLTQTMDVMNSFINKIREIKVESNNLSVPVRVSIGVTAFPEKTQEIVGIIDRADKAMYYSKQHGRDRITIDGEYVED